jgi:hypothetical protein
MSTVVPQQGVRPEIVENYRDFEPPANFRRSLDELLDAVPTKYLVGLKTILLTNRTALTRDQRRQKTWSRNRKIRLADARGWYQGASRSSPASICLYVDNILQSEQPWMRRVPLLRYEALGTVLYHEIGHHIHAVHKPIFAGKENVAEDWSRKLFVRFLRLRYWYLKPLFYPPALIARLVRRLRGHRSLRRKIG